MALASYTSPKQSALYLTEIEWHHAHSSMETKGILSTSLACLFQVMNFARFHHK